MASRRFCITFDFRFSTGTAEDISNFWDNLADSLPISYEIEYQYGICCDLVSLNEQACIDDLIELVDTALLASSDPSIIFTIDMSNRYIKYN